MPNEFISPNWHVVIMHLPLGLLLVGVLIELFSCRCANGGVRTAGRWMILIGALLLLPTMTLGLYAFRDVVTGGPSDVNLTLHQVEGASPWSAVQWLYMKRHILLMSIATALFLLGALAGMGADNEGRRRVRLPVLLVLLVGLGVMVAGAWYSGEAVYRYGTAVEHAPATPATAPTEAPSPAGSESEAQPGRINYYIPNLELHLLLVGFTVALAMGALGVSFRRWSWRPPTAVETAIPETVPRPEPSAAVARPPIGTGVYVPTITAPPNVAPFIRPARFWLLAFLLGIATAVVGLWVADDWKLEALLTPLRDAGRRTEMQRVFYHVIFGSNIVVLTLLLAIITRVSRRAKGITLLLALLLVLAVAAQVWMGILLLFDSDHGPLTGFNA